MKDKRYSEEQIVKIYIEPGKPTRNAFMESFNALQQRDSKT